MTEVRATLWFLIFGLWGCQRSSASPQPAVPVLPSAMPVSSALAPEIAQQVIAKAPTGGLVLETAVFRRSRTGSWPAGCVAQQGCSFGPALTLRCTAGIAPKNWTELLAAPERYSEQVVSVRGRIELSGSRTTDAMCAHPRRCCNHTEHTVVLAGDRPLTLDGLFCEGDDSQQCCNAPAYGQSIVATGRLRKGNGAGGITWLLAEATLCTE